MEFSFRTRKLEKCYLIHKEARKAWGEQVAKSYAMCVQAIGAVVRSSDLYTLPYLGFHPLAGDKKGKYAMSLGNRARLILELHWKGKDETVEILDVDVTHYGN